MESQFDIKQVLRVFQKILDHGQKIDNAYRFGGITAESDFDGYNLLLFDDAVKLHIFFHNTHKFDFKRNIELDAFMDKIKHIDKLGM